MGTIIILSSSIRTGRKSHRVAEFIANVIQSDGVHQAEMHDLNHYRFPVFEERLKFLADPLPELLALSDAIRASVGVIIVAPEYNGSFPAALKNVLDVFTDEWKMKPIGLCAVSGGHFGGAQLLQSLQFTLWKVGAWVVPASFQVPFVDKTFKEDGSTEDTEGLKKRLKLLTDKLYWSIEANARMQEA
ncbi:MAG: NAD(P)H-dependent oxidoreductase [Ferruginibacter sp.]|nr:NAD(P)H-dependent oxidoreductase [Ferruginibacter sp.]